MTRPNLLPALLLTALLAGCATTEAGTSKPQGGSPQGASPQSAPSGHPAALDPTGPPSPAVVPGPDPAGSRVVTAPGYRIAVPADFKRRERITANKEPIVMLSRPSSVPGVKVGVVIAREPNPSQGVREDSYTLELTKRTVEQATDLSRSMLSWPDSPEGALTQWTQPMAGTDGATVPVRYWQLNLQTKKELRLIVVGAAPVKDFDDSEIAAAVASFRVQP